MKIQARKLQKKAEKNFQTANQLYQKGQLEEAINFYRLAVEINPEKAEYFFKLGEVLTKKDKLQEAVNCYHHALKINPKGFRIYFSLGIALEKQSLINQAVNNYQKTIDLNPKFAWAYFNLGNILYQQGLYDEAASYYQKAIKVHPPAKSFWFHVYLGDTLLKQSKTKEAIQCYQRANAITPDSSEIKRKLGLAYVKQEKFDRAIACYKQAIKLNSGLFQAYLELGEILDKQGCLNEAISYFRQALKIKPNSGICYQRLQECTRKISGIQDIELQNHYKSIEDNPDDYELYIKLGKALAKRGLLDESIKQYLKVIQIKPDSFEVYENLKNATLYSNNIEEVINTYVQIVKKNQNIIPAYVNLTDALTKQGKITEAINYYKKAIYEITRSKNHDFVKKYWDNSLSGQPSFIIIGAEKCGTSSLYNYIIQHPNVLEAVEKEIHFFTQNFGCGLDWYQSHFPAIPAELDYLTGEASTSYIGCHNNAHHRLFNLFPKMKIIALFRDPSARSVSQYNQLVKLGREQRSMAEVFSAEMEVLQGVDDIWSVHQAYWKIGKGCIWNSIYSSFLEKWMRLFPKEQLLIIKSENLFSEPAIIMSRVFTFLDLPDYQLDSYPNYNPGGVYRQMDASMEQTLKKFFLPYNQKLEKLLQ